MRKFELLVATAAIAVVAAPGAAQVTATTAAPQTSNTAAGGTASDPGFADDIIVTAQRTRERLQDVPIAVSAFTGAALEAQQIHNSLDLQLSLPNITFTKTNYTASSFTIRGIGDLCNGFSCDTATGIHINDVPVPATRLFETEFLDLERVEVLRGPQGTLFGRNATSGVVNFITARPDLTGFHVSGSGEYSNYNSYKLQGVVNLPLTSTLGVRFAGQYLNRDGFTQNLFDNRRFDGRDLYQGRASLRWQPTPNTTIDLLGSYFREKDDRSRAQKLQCHRDPTAVLGCLPDRLANETVNYNSTFGGVLTSREFLGIAVAPAFANFGEHSVYGPDSFAGSVVPADVRTVNTNVRPSYFADEINAQLRVEQKLGEKLTLTVIGGYNRSRVDSRASYFLNAPDSLTGNPGIAAFRAQPFAANANKYVFDGAGNLCAGNADRSYSGVFSGNTVGCFATPYNFDRSRQTSENYSAEVHLNSNFDGRFNFLLGGIYLSGKTDGDYFVSQSEANYAAAVLGVANSLNPANGVTPGSVYLGPALFNSEVDRYRLKSYGIFGETYLQVTPTVKATVGLRYSHDQKSVTDRNPILNFLVPYGLADAFTSPFALKYDFDPSRPGVQAFRQADVSFGRLTGRAVVDWKFARNSLAYVSYSRGYKSGGINPPFDAAVFTAPVTFRPESVDSFEIGTKNTFAGGAVRLNASAFYYKYKDLQLSRIINRTSFNDNTNADIYGLELETVIKPDRHLVANISFSYLETKIKGLSLADGRDPSGGRSDTVIIKDITAGTNCVVRPTVAGNAAGANLLVTAINGSIGLKAPTPIPGTNTTGAFSICSALLGQIANPSAGLRTLFNVPTGALPFVFNTTVTGAPLGLPDGVPVNLDGKQLPNAPRYKASVGLQHTLELGHDLNFVSRIDLSYTGNYYARSYNQPIDRIPGYAIANASVQLNGPQDRYFVRGFVQNLTANNAITGQFANDASSGLFTNIFTLEPRRYGVGAGFKF